jgi:hypothetical protein
MMKIYLEKIGEQVTYAFADSAIVEAVSAAI